jgi:myo-inositol-1(or 4)-monophosphatase
MTTFDTNALIGWLEQAGTIARSYFKEVVGQRKQDRTWVTQADLEIEQYLIGQIHSHFPGHGILGEETGSADSGAEYIWAIDPIDGTQSFIQGLPGWSVSLGLIRNGLPLLGFVYIPTTDDHYWCEAGGGAFCNGKPIHVRSSAEIDKSDWLALTSRSHLSYQITFPGKVRGFGSIATHLCYVARDAAVGALLGGEGRGALWDIAAGVLRRPAPDHRRPDGRRHDRPAPARRLARGTAPAAASYQADGELLRFEIRDSRFEIRDSSARISNLESQRA